MQCWQRGTSFTGNGAANTYGADRWKYYNNGTSLTVSRQATGDTTNLPNIQYCQRVARNNASTNTNANYIEQSFESVNSIPFAGKTVTISFYARKGANYSASSSVLNCRLQTGTGTDQSWLSGYTGDITIIETTPSITTSWVRYTATGNVGATATELAIVFTSNPTGTAGAADYYEVTGVQIEVGSVATPFKSNGATFQGELAACQRYYYRVTNPGSTSDPMMPAGFAVATTQANMWQPAPVSMRVTPTSLDSANIRFFDGVSAFSPTITIGSCTNYILGIAGTTTGLTQFRPYYAIASTSINASYLGWSAEL
jgi:hypothetical protein